MSQALPMAVSPTLSSPLWALAGPFGLLKQCLSPRLVHRSMRKHPSCVPGGVCIESSMTCTVCSDARKCTATGSGAWNWKTCSCESNSSPFFFFVSFCWYGGVGYCGYDHLEPVRPLALLYIRDADCLGPWCQAPDRVIWYGHSLPWTLRSLNSGVWSATPT